MRLRGSTTAERFADDSRRWLSGSVRTPLPLASLESSKKLPEARFKSTERALQVVYSAILPSILKRSSPGWGPGPLSTERSWEFFCALGDELGEWNWRLAEGQDPSGDSIRRVERSHREEAAGEVVDLVRRMPTPIRIVLEARSCGVPWKRMTAELPDRAYFSMVDDWRRGVGTLTIFHEHTVRRLS